MKIGIALCPEDRKDQGIVGDLTIRENIILALQARFGWFRFLNTQKQYEIAEKYIQLLGIITPSSDQLVKNLSGANQQKVVFAKLASVKPKVLLLDEPTQGVDVQAKVEIMRIVDQLVREGVAVIVISEEIREMLELCDRILVMYQGEIVREFKNGDQCCFCPGDHVPQGIARSRARPVDGDASASLGLFAFLYCDGAGRGDDRAPG